LDVWVFVLVKKEGHKEFVLKPIISEILEKFV